MPIVPLASPEDPRLAIYRHLKATNQTRGAGLFVLEGEKLLRRLIESPHYQLHSVLVAAHHAERIAALISEGVPVYTLEERLLGEIVGYRFHLGVVSAGRRQSWDDIHAMCGTHFAQHGHLTLVVCPAVNDPENLGAIARIADTFGAVGILAGPGCPDPLSRRVLRVSMGAVLRLPVWVDEKPEVILEGLAKCIGLRTAAAVASGHAIPIARFQRPPALALVLGNEAQGLPPEWIARCDHSVTIPMRPGADSLNVAIAAGILLFCLTTTNGCP